jgi:hypothetical protein
MPVFFQQKVNSFLCIALVSLMAFWTVLFYLTHKAEAIGDQYISSLTFPRE